MDHSKKHLKTIIDFVINRHSTKIYNKVCLKQGFQNGLKYKYRKQHGLLIQFYFVYIYRIRW